MSSLINDLQEKKISLAEFENLALRVLEYLPNVLSEKLVEKNGYNIHFSESAGTTKFVRPINQRLFIYSPDAFRKKQERFREAIESSW